MARLRMPSERIFVSTTKASSAATVVLQWSFSSTCAPSTPIITGGWFEAKSKQGQKLNTMPWFAFSKLMNDGLE
eukprot:scaffold680997_cov59-Prasinocladus_malaysianus.AAC.1